MQENLARVLEELHRMQLQGLAGVANLVGAVVHEINSPLSALTSAADVSSRCAQRMRAIVASVASVKELRGSTQFERALDLVEENSRLILAAAQSIGEQTAVLGEFSLSVPQLEAPPSLGRILDEVLAILERDFEDGTQVIRDYGDAPAVSMREPVLEWMLLECIRHVMTCARGVPVRLSTVRHDEQRIAVTMEYSGPDRRHRNAELTQWVKRAGAEMRTESTYGSRVLVQLLLPCEARL